MKRADIAAIQETLEAHLTEATKGRGKPVERIDGDQPFFEAGILDSLSLLDFVTFVEGQFGIAIPGGDIVPQNFGTLRAVSEYIFERVKAAA